MSTTDPTSFRMSDEAAAGLIEEYHRTGDIAIRNQVVEAHAWLARVRARRLMRRSESLDDLVQVLAGVRRRTLDHHRSALPKRFRSGTLRTVLLSIARPTAATSG